MKYSIEQLDVSCYQEGTPRTGGIAVSFTVPRGIGIIEAAVLPDGRIRVVVAQSPQAGRAEDRPNAVPSPVVVAPEPPAATFDAYPRAEQARVLDRVLADAGISVEDDDGDRFNADFSGGAS